MSDTFIATVVMWAILGSIVVSMALFAIEGGPCLYERSNAKQVAFICFIGGPLAWLGYGVVYIYRRLAD